MTVGSLMRILVSLLTGERTIDVLATVVSIHRAEHATTKIVYQELNGEGNFFTVFIAGTQPFAGPQKRLLVIHRRRGAVAIVINDTRHDLLPQPLRNSQH